MLQLATVLLAALSMLSTAASLIIEWYFLLFSALYWLDTSRVLGWWIRVDSSESNHITLIHDMSLLEVAEDIRYAPLCLWQLLMQFTSFLVSCCSCLVILNRFVCFFSWMPRSSNKKQTGWISLSPLQ